MDELIEELKKASDGVKEYIKQNVDLLENYIDLHKEFTNTDENLLQKLYNSYLKYLDVENEVELDQDYAIASWEIQSFLKKDDYKDFLGYSLFEIILELNEKLMQLGEEHDFFYIADRYHYVLQTDVDPYGIHYNCNGTKASISYAQIYEFLKTNKTLKDYVKELAPIFYDRMIKVAYYNKKFINFAIRQKNEIDFTEFCANKKTISEHKQDLNKMYCVLQDHYNFKEDFYTQIKSDKIKNLMRDLYANYIRTKNFALASLVIGLKNYDMNEFKEALLYLENLV